MPIERIPFNEIFRENPDGSLTPLREINVNGLSVGTGISFTKGVAIGGVDFNSFKDNDIAAENENGVLVIKGYFSKETAADTTDQSKS